MVNDMDTLHMNTLVERAKGMSKEEQRAMAYEFDEQILYEVLEAKQVLRREKLARIKDVVDFKMGE